MFKVICNIGCAAAAHSKSTQILSFVTDIYKSMYKELQQKQQSVTQINWEYSRWLKDFAVGRVAQMGEIKNAHKC